MERSPTKRKDAKPITENTVMPGIVIIYRNGSDTPTLYEEISRREEAGWKVVGIKSGGGRRMVDYHGLEETSETLILKDGSGRVEVSGRDGVIIQSPSVDSFNVAAYFSEPND